MTSDALIEANLGLVHACAKRFVGKGVEYEELYAAGCEGLTKAARRFDPTLGYKLSTYAVPVILGEIKGLFRSGGTVRVSRSLKELSLRAQTVADEYRRTHGGEITLTKLAERLNVDIFRLSEALSAAMPALSLSPSEDEGAVDIPTQGPEDQLCERLSLQQVLSQLTDEERALISCRYYQHKTQSQTAAILGTTQVQISRCEKKILTKLRQMLTEE